MRYAASILGRFNLPLCGAWPAHEKLEFTTIYRRARSVSVAR